MIEDRVIGDAESRYAEYISSYIAVSDGSLNFLNLNDRWILPRYIDDLSRDLRLDIYDQMLLDAQCAACYGVLVDGILGGDLTILPGKKDPRAADMAEFVRSNLFDHLETDLETEVFPELLRAMVVGNRIAEKVYYDPAKSPIKGKLCLQRIKAKPRTTVAFYTDRFKNVIGVADLNAPLPGQVGYAIYPPEKFVWLTWDIRDSDPRGTSVFRPAYDPWWFKQKIKPIEGKHLTAFGSPSVVATLSPEAQKRPKTDSFGNTLYDSNGDILYDDPGKNLETAVKQFMSAGYIILPDGTKLDLLQPTENGAAFVQAKAAYNLEIVKAITYQQIATESSSASAGAAGVAADILEMPMDRSIVRLKNRADRQIIRPLIDLNYPDPQDYPTFEIPGAKRSNLLAWASAIAKLALAGCIHPEQLNDIFSRYLNFPQLTKSAIEDLKKAMEAKTQIKAAGGAPNPNANKTQVKNQESGNA